MHPYLELIRPINALMAAVAVYLGFALSMGGFTVNLEVILLMVAVVCISGAGQTLNDFFDCQIDAKIHPHRPIPSKCITAKHAFGYAVFLFVIGNLLSLLVGIIPFTISFLCTGLLVFYAGFGKPYKWLGNWIVGFQTGLLFLFGATLTENYTLAFMLALPAMLSNVAREITKDLEDEKNGEVEKTTLSIVVGKSNTKTIAKGVTLLAMGAAIVPYFKQLLPVHYLIGIVIAWVLFISAINALSKNDYAKAQKRFKNAMMAAMLGFAIGLIPV